MARWLLVCTLVCLAVHVQCMTYYASSESGNDDADCDTFTHSSTPARTLSAAIKCSAEGDAVQASGDFQEDVVIVSSIALRAWDGMPAPVIRPTGDGARAIVISVPPAADGVSLVQFSGVVVDVDRDAATALDIQSASTSVVWADGLMTSNASQCTFLLSSASSVDVLIMSSVLVSAKDAAFVEVFGQSSGIVIESAVLKNVGVFTPGGALLNVTSSSILALDSIEFALNPSGKAVLLEVLFDGVRNAVSVTGGMTTVNHTLFAGIGGTALRVGAGATAAVSNSSIVKSAPTSGMIVALGHVDLHLFSAIDVHASSNMISVENGQLTMSVSLIANCSGGVTAISVSSGSADVRTTTIIQSEITAIAVHDGDASLKLCRVHRNAGAGARVTGGRLSVHGTSFEENTGRGALEVLGGSAFVEKSLFARNAVQLSSVIAVHSGRLELSGVSSHFNTATGDGGGLNVAGGSVVAHLSRFSANAAANGGGVAVAGGEVELNGVLVTNNVAHLSGGGIALTGGTLTASFVNITQNAAESGGGVYVKGDLSAEEVLIGSNVAHDVGGGVLCDHGSASFSTSLISGNSASTDGAFSCNECSYSASLTPVVSNHPQSSCT